VVAEVAPGIRIQADDTGSALLRWDVLVEKKQETWPIWLLVPGGAYIQQAN
jgi:hypothetical protein